MSCGDVEKERKKEMRALTKGLNYLVQKSELAFGFLFLQPFPFKDEIMRAIRFLHPTLRPCFLYFRVYLLPLHSVHVVLLSDNAYDFPKSLLVILLGHELLRGLPKTTRPLIQDVPAFSKGITPGKAYD